MYQTEQRQVPSSMTDDRPRSTDHRHHRRGLLRRGVVAIEYSLLLSVIGIVAIGVVQRLGVDTQNVLNEVASSLKGGAEGDDGNDGAGAGSRQDGDEDNKDANGKGNGEDEGKGKDKSKGKGKGKDKNKGTGKREVRDKERRGR